MENQGKPLILFSSENCFFNYKQIVEDYFQPLFTDYLVDIETDEILRFFGRFLQEGDQLGYKTVYQQIFGVIEKFSAYFNLNILESDKKNLLKTLPAWGWIPDVPKVLEELKSLASLFMVVEKFEDVLSVNLQKNKLFFDHCFETDSIPDFSRIESLQKAKGTEHGNSPVFLISQSKYEIMNTKPERVHKVLLQPACLMAERLFASPDIFTVESLTDLPGLVKNLV